jgi:hypothetical protein
LTLGVLDSRIVNANVGGTEKEEGPDLTDESRRTLKHDAVHVALKVSVSGIPSSTVKLLVDVHEDRGDISLFKDRLQLALQPLEKVGLLDPVRRPELLGLLLVLKEGQMTGLERVQIDELAIVVILGEGEL